MPKEETRLGFEQTKLPWIVAGGALVVFLLTLNHWVNLRSLPVVAKVTGWDWAPPIQWPLFFTLTYPFRWLPDGWEVIALNVFTAICGALTLALLARSVALLPHDRTHDQRIRERSEFSLLSIRGAWLPPLFAVLVCGLQLTFWEHATAITVEMLDLLLFAYCVRCLLEYRISHGERWLVKLAFVYGLGITNNWAMIGFFPLFVVALVWIMGLSFFRGGFILRMLGAGAAGLLLYFLLPVIWMMTQQTEYTFFELLKANWLGQKAFLVDASVLRNRALILSLVSILPVILMGIRWPSSFGDTSAAGATLTLFMFRVVHLVFLGVCLWVAFDPKFSPRALGYGLAFLSFYYLAALAIGYYSGFALLVFTDLPKKSYRRQSELARLFNPVVRGAVWVALIGVPIGLIYQNWPVVRASNGPTLKEYVATTVQALPSRPSYVLSDDPAQILLLEGYFRTEGGESGHVLLNTRALENPSYHRELSEHYGEKWPGIGDLEEHGARIEHAVLQNLVVRLTEQAPVFYLHPSFGYFFERVYALPQGLVYPLQAYRPEQILPPVLTPQQAEETESFWNSQSEFLERVRRLARSGIQEGVYLGSMYARAINDWGVEMQKLEQLKPAEAHFARAAELSTNNAAARINLDFNRALQSGKKMADPEQINKQLSEYRTIDQLLSAGDIDEPNVRIWAGTLLITQSLYRQTIQQLTRALHFQPTNYHAGLTLSKALVFGNWPDEALAQVQKVRQQAPGLSRTNELELLSVEAAALYAKDDFEKAEAMLKEAVAQNPGQMAVTKSLFDFYRLGQRFTNALEVAEQALRASPTNTMWMIQKVETHLAMEDYAGAEKALDATLEQAPDNTAALLYKAFIPIQQGNFEQALPWIERVLSKQPKNAQALLYRGIIHLERKNFEKAREALDAVLEQQPAHTTALRNRALLNLRSDNLEEAQKDYERLRQITPRSYAAFYGLGEIAYKQQQYQDALKHYERYLKYAPEGKSATLQEEREKVIARVNELKSRGG